MSVRRLAEKQPASFAFTPENLSWAKAQIGKYPEGRQQSAVIPILWRAQEQCGGWLPQKAIEATADLLGMARIRVLEVATFYTMFNLAPVGRFHVQLCGTTPCMLRGSEDLKKVCRRMIGEENHVTADGTFSWIEVECLGACVNAPMVQINADYYEDLTPESLTRIINDQSAGRKPKPGPQIDRINSAPIGGPTTLTDPALFAGNGKGAEAHAPSGADSEAKKPGEAANLRDAPMPKPPEGDATDPRRN
jgi:NADH-quinone oxidoreductase subunit E